MNNLNHRIPQSFDNDLQHKARVIHSSAKEVADYYKVREEDPTRHNAIALAIAKRLSRETGLPLETFEQADSLRKKAWQAANTPDLFEVEEFRPAQRGLPAHAAPPSGLETVGVFTLLKGAQKAYKKIIVSPEAEFLNKESFTPNLTFWTAVSVGFATLEDVRDWYAKALTWEGYLTRTPMIPYYAPQAQSVRRAYNPSATPLGSLDNPAFAPEGSRLIIFDIDNLTVPLGTDVRDVELMVELIRLQLPPEAADADLMIAPSAGHGAAKGGEINVRFHAFAILNRPLDNDEGRRWFELHDCKYLDAAMLSRTQPCFILREAFLPNGSPAADPFKHMECYISKGSHAVIRVPDLAELGKPAARLREVKAGYTGEQIAAVLKIWPSLTGQDLVDHCELIYGEREPRQGRAAAPAKVQGEKRPPGRPKAAAAPPKLTGGLKDALLAVGDHDGGVGFHAPLKRAAALMWADRRYSVDDAREAEIIELLTVVIWNADALASRSLSDDQESYVRRKMPQVVKAIRLSEANTRAAEKRRVEAQREAMVSLPTKSLEESRDEIRMALDAALGLPLNMPRAGMTEEKRGRLRREARKLREEAKAMPEHSLERLRKESEARCASEELRCSFMHHPCAFEAFEEHDDGTLEILFKPTIPLPAPGARPLTDLPAILESMDQRIPYSVRLPAALQECGALSPDGFGLTLKVTPGASKTYTAAEAIKSLFERDPDAAVLWLTPDHGLAEETAVLIDGKVYRGRPSEDAPEDVPENWCVNEKQMNAWQWLGGDMDSFCHGRCERRKECGYMAQAETLKKPRVMMRAEGLAALTRGQPQLLADKAKWPTPDVIIADDCTVQRIKQSAKIPAATLLKAELTNFNAAYELVEAVLSDYHEERFAANKVMVEAWLNAVSAEFMMADSHSGCPVTVGQVRKLVPRFTPDAVRALRIRPPLLQKAGVLDALLEGRGAARAVSTYNYHLRWIERLVTALRALKLEDAPDHRVIPGWQFEDVEIATAEGRKVTPCLNFTYPGELAEAFAGIPLIVLDATAPPALLKLLKPRMVIQEIATAETNVRRTLYLVNSAKEAWAERVAYIDQWARHQARAFGCDLSAVGIITHLDAAASLRRMHGGEPPYRVMHFNATRGRNGMKGVRVLGVFGRTLAPSSQVHAISLALSGEVTEDRGSSKVEVALRMRDGDTADAYRYSVGGGDVLEAVQWEIVEGELIQADGRARGVRRGADEPVDIFHFCDVGAGELVWDAVVKATADFDHLTGWRAVVASALDAGVRPLGRSGPIWARVFGVTTQTWADRRVGAAGYYPGTVGEWLDNVADEAREAATADAGVEVVTLGAGGERLGRAVLMSPGARGWLDRFGLEVLAVETGRDRADSLR